MHQYWMVLIFNLFLADEWRFHRKNLNPSFHYNVVKSFYPTFNKKLKIFIKRLRTYVGKPFRLQHYIESCAMDMICGKYLGKFIENIKSLMNIVHQISVFLNLGLF